VRKTNLMRLGVAAALISGVLAFGTTVLVTSSAGAASTYTCSGGSPTSPTLIPAGNYGRVTVTGFCYMQGSYTIRGGLSVAPGAELDAAVMFGFPPYTYGTFCNVFVNVSGGIQVGAGGVLYFGNGPGTNCPSSNDVVNGRITSTGGDTVVIHGTTVNGGISAKGGGGAGDCAPTGPAPFGSFTDVEDSQINGGLSITGLNTCWIGTIRNQVNGVETVANNETSDTDAIEIGLNTIHGGLGCSGNFLNPVVPPDTTTPNAPNGVPTNFFDGVGPNPNTIAGRETGQCVGL
jgi:hypothetical protein